MPETLHESSGRTALHVHEKRRLTGLDGVSATTRNAWNCASPGMRSEEASPACCRAAPARSQRGVQNLTGISQPTIDPTAGNNQNPGAQVAIQQRITGTLLLTFSTDVTSTQRQTLQLQYQPKRQVKISVIRDEYGGYGIDVRLHKVF